MKERPILFSGTMVRALLAGTKTQTRRVMKLANGQYIPPSKRADVNGWNQLLRNCPYGQPGDRLWVRESWAADPEDDGSWGYTSWAGCRNGRIAGVPEKFRLPEYVIYAADWKHDPLLWTPSIHMPRWASRILLEITEVRVERLQHISEADALAEGIVPHVRGGWHWHPHNPADMDDWHQFGFKTAAFAYRDLWERLGGDWSANPWVWAVSFRVITPISALDAPKDQS